MRIRLQLFAIFAPMLAAAASAQQSFETLQSASMLFGQQSFYHGETIPSDSVTPNPISVAASSDGLVAVGEAWPGRVLIWKLGDDEENLGAPAELILGEPNPGSNVTVPSASEIGSADAILFPGDGRMIVADSFHNRVLIWNSLASPEASVVIGQDDFVTNGPGTTANRFRSPSGLALTPDGRLIVSDSGNNRVLIFNRIPAYNGASADIVIGQSDMTSRSEAELYEPVGVAVNGAGVLAIADSANDRVVMYERVPWSNGAVATAVLGDATVTRSTRLSSPLAVAFSRFGTLAIADTNNHRVLLYEPDAVGRYDRPSMVLGQPDFVSIDPYNGGTGDQAISKPVGTAWDFYGRLYATGRTMRRTVGFGAPNPVILSLSPSSGSAAGGTTITVSGRGLNAAGAIVTIGDRKAASRSTDGSISIISPSLNPGTLNDVMVNIGRQTAVLPRGWFAEFLDVPSSNPFAAAVEAAVRARLTAGCGGGEFCADRPASRAEAAVLVELAKRGTSFQPAPATGQMFADVPAGSFAAEWIEQLAKDRITAGCGAGMFCPAAALTHAQVAVLVVAAKYGAEYRPPPATGHVYLDMARGSFAAAFAEKLAADGIALSPERYFRPDAPTTRAELAYVLTKMFGLQ